MADKKAGFIVGANAKIKMFGETVAFAQSVSYDIQTDTIPIEVMGKYEVVSYEPVGSRVSGSLSIIRYTGRAKASNIENTADKGDGPTQIGEDGNNANQHLNPAELLQSQTFDLDIFEMTSDGETNMFRVQDCRLVRRGMQLNKRGAMTDAYNFVGILAGDMEDDSLQVSGSGAQDLS